MAITACDTPHGSLNTNTMVALWLQPGSCVTICTACQEPSSVAAGIFQPRLLRFHFLYRRVLEKLLHGEHTSLGVIGGSVSYGYGVRRGSSDWFSIFTSYLRSAFPKASITTKNGCVPAAQSEYISMCLEKFVNQDADLIFVEVRMYGSL